MFRHRTVYLVLAMLLAPWYTMHAATESPLRLPAPEEGNVDGRQGLIFWPIDASRGDALVDPADCDVHLSLHDELRSKQVYDCGKWFALPAGSYTVWLTKGMLVSDQFIVISPGSRFDDNGLVVTAPLRPGASVRVDPVVALRAGETFRLLALDDPSSEFDLSLTRDEARGLVVVPAGKLVTGVFREDGSLKALTPPLPLAPGDVKMVTPRVPKMASDVMVVLSKQSALVAMRKERGIEATLVSHGRTWLPEVRFESDGRFVAIWYGVTPGAAEITIESKAFAREVLKLDLKESDAVVIRQSLRQ